MRILVVDDHPMVRKGLISTLSALENIREVREAANIQETLDLVSVFGPDVILVDLLLGGEDGLKLISEVRTRKPSVKSIILTSSSRRDDFLRDQEMEVEGYILKEAFPEDIIYAIGLVTRGKNYIDPEFAQYNAKEKDGYYIEVLTHREKEVLLELSKGLSNNQIAKALFISENTVKKHVSNILAKLGLSQRLDAALYLNNLTMGG